MPFILKNTNVKENCLHHNIFQTLNEERRIFGHGVNNCHYLNSTKQRQAEAREGETERKKEEEILSLF